MARRIWNVLMHRRACRDLLNKGRRLLSPLCFLLLGFAVSLFLWAHRWVVIEVQQSSFQGYDFSEPLALEVVSNDTWIRVPLPPDLKNCRHQFRHCCLGVCRHDEQNQLDNVLFKWNEKRKGAGVLANLTDLLAYMHVHMGRWKKQTPKKAMKKLHQKSDSIFGLRHGASKKASIESPPSCNIVFFGDSLSADTASAAVCQLTSTGGYTLTSCDPLWLGLPVYGTDRVQRCGPNDPYHDLRRGHMLELAAEAKNKSQHPFAQFVLEKNAGSCPKVRIVFAWVGLPFNHLTLNSPGSLSSVLDSLQHGGIVLWNWGVHCNKINWETNDYGCMRNMLEGGLLPLVKGANATKYVHWSFFYREHEPQHFPTAGGQWNARPTGAAGAFACSPTVAPGDNWRNQYAVAFLAEHNLTDKVPVIRLFYDLVPLWQLHKSGIDCTHYCYSPWRFDLTWDRTLKALKLFQ